MLYTFHVHSAANTNHMPRSEAGHQSHSSKHANHAQNNGVSEQKARARRRHRILFVNVFMCESISNLNFKTAQQKKTPSLFACPRWKLCGVRNSAHRTRSHDTYMKGTVLFLVLPLWHSHSCRPARFAAALNISHCSRAHLHFPSAKKPY